MTVLNRFTDRLRRWARSRPLTRQAAPSTAASAVNAGRIAEAIDRQADVLFVTRADALLVLICADGVPDRALLAGQPLHMVQTWAREGRYVRVWLRTVEADGRVTAPVDATPWLDALKAMADVSVFGPGPPAFPAVGHALYNLHLGLLSSNPDLIDFAYQGHKASRASVGDFDYTPPFDLPEHLPALAYPAPQRRSAVFVHNNYYHFNVLAAALRKQGWDALSVSVEPMGTAERQFLHGEDLNLVDPDWAQMQTNIRDFLAVIPQRFGAMHFSGQAMASLFPENFSAQARPVRVPWDFMELRRQRVLIGFTPSGCCDIALQSSIKTVTGGLCSHCVWEHRPDICSDAKNGAWVERMEALCDWVALDGDWSVDQARGPRYVREPVVCGLDADLWRPGRKPPAEMVLARAPGEVLVYHAVGNYAVRQDTERDLKGTSAVFAAIETLQAEGLPVRLIFVTDALSTEVRYLQSQADIVIDQLHYGRPGANARECLMLGKPVIARVLQPPAPEPPLRFLTESPVVHADTATLTDVLRELVLDPRRRARLGVAGRKYAVKWYSGDVCAQRYGRVIDRLRAGLCPEHPSIIG